MTELSRRSFLTGRRHSAAQTLRPPWSGAESDFLSQCTRCDACIAACAGGILRRGPGGFPMVDFQRGECSFCYDCARACPQALFSARHTAPWDCQMTIGDGCLSQRQVECRCCQDACEPGAIAFHPTLRRIAAPSLDNARCITCGACIAGCPSGAISMQRRPAPTRQEIP
ncbi:ferredoxin-type protein NapF [Brenneria corticis]|uniref:Ferredoxin-type protein NapF n=1 Tax=Brenneria corticis TaxID=2173106 RepID=A0A2U1U466_9GAMM|nr:ferredoxin-type protein NapF [Brenneria sp. CFCC 11842]PWC16450.1 ferredoxin-type protein NapF [Brenneria sp. CFCC 11842]